MELNKKNFVFSIIVVIGTLVFLELLLYILSLVFPIANAILSRLPQNVIEDTKLGWRPNPKYPDHDQKGFRNKQISHEVSIVAMGDSQTYGFGVSPNHAWPQLLEVLLKEKSYNMSCPGYSPLQSLLLWEEATAFKPRLIIEAVYAGNDLYESYSFVYDRKKFSDFASTDQRLIKAMNDAENIEPLAERIDRVFWIGQATDKRYTAKHGALREFLSEHSNLYGVFRAVKRVYERKYLGDVNNWEIINREAIRNKEYLQVFYNGRVKTVFTPKYRLLGLNLNDPRIREGHRIFLEAIRLMEQRARSENISFVVLLIPTKETAFKDVVYKHATEMLEEYKVLVENEELLLQNTKKFLGNHGIHYIDALPILREYIWRDTQPYFISTDNHLNAIGQQAVAELVLSEIKRYGLLGKTGR